MDKQSKEMQELDAWLGENPMAWHTDTSKSFYFDSRHRQVMSVVSWHPTTSIVQAFAVVDKLYQDRDFLSSLFCVFDAGALVWRASFFKKFTGGYQITAKTRELAICQAAKKAMEAK
ncbi:unnamed protein product [marine sediment metagenome]|uniref:Phage ABA sandwich domain-containing protein n=1 Tax=marine sediment metagenome TaxID=412755 RepID=X1HIF6_9ZZZZ